MSSKYYLGISKEDNVKVYLEKESWDCNWYWGFGYVTSKYFSIHFDTLFLEENIFDSFKEFFIETPLTDNQIWKLLGYMKEYYVMKNYAELLQYGNHITGKAECILQDKYIDKNNEEVERINKVILPDLFKKIENLFKEIKGEN